MQRVTCHACKQPGHWAKDCPDKQMNKSMPSSSTPRFVNDHAIPDKQCPHCGGMCVVLTSNTESNPGRKFYKCPENGGNNNSFFQWCYGASPAGHKRDIPVSPSRIKTGYSSISKSCWSETGLDKKQDSPQFPCPECPCGAGICELLTANSGKDKGNKYFVCPVKKGQGACNFFQWQDSPGITLNRYHEDVGENLDTLTSTPGSHEKKKTTYKDMNNGNDLKNVSNNMNINGHHGMISPGSARKSVHHVREETVGLDSAILHYFGDLDLSEKKTSFVAKPGTCFRCGQEGHWIKDCLNPINSICYKCGKVGHWKSDCPH